MKNKGGRDLTTLGLVVTSSLTKVYGMGAVRSGWILCPPDVRSEAARLLDYLTVLAPAPSASAAELVLGHADEVRKKAHEVSRAGWAVLSAWMAGRDDVHCATPAGGLTAFCAFDGIDDTGPLCEWLLAERDTAIVPGAFFGDPTRARIGFGVAPETLEPALAHLADALDQIRDR